MSGGRREDLKLCSVLKLCSESRPRRGDDRMKRGVFFCYVDPPPRWVGLGRDGKKLTHAPNLRSCLQDEFFDGKTDEANRQDRAD